MPLKHTVEEIILKNGARGLLIYTPGATSVRIDVSFRAGTGYVQNKKVSQAAHIMEHMLFGPNERYQSAEAFSEDFEKNGAYHNAWTSDTTINYYADAPIMDWERVLDLQLLAITAPTFTQDNLDAEKGNVREEIVGYGNTHGRLLWQLMAKKTGLKRWFDADELKTIEAVQLEDIRQHYKATHSSNNMQFIIAGDLESYKSKIISLFESVALPAGSKMLLPKDHANASGPVHIYRKDLPSIRFSFYLYLERELTRRELRAVTNLSYILTGTFHSRVFGRARKRGICYSMGSHASTEPTGTSSFEFYGQVQEENAKELLKLTVSQLKEVASRGVTKEELAGAKQNRLGSLQMELETVRSLTGWYASKFYDNNYVDHVSDMPGLIEETTQQEIQNLAKEFLESGVWSFGEIGNITEQITNEHYSLLDESLAKR